jgi:hypothetical protein
MIEKKGFRKFDSSAERASEPLEKKDCILLIGLNSIAFLACSILF